jgi:hypothetical protein
MGGKMALAARCGKDGTEAALLVSARARAKPVATISIVAHAEARSSRSGATLGPRRDQESCCPYHRWLGTGLPGHFFARPLGNMGSDSGQPIHRPCAESTAKGNGG